MASLQNLRQEIDGLDEKIVELLNARARAAVEIGRLKADAGTAVFAPDREREILDRLTALSGGPLSKESLHAVYRELMSASFALERQPRVGYLGPEGSFSHEAAIGKFGSSVEYEPLVHLEGVFDALARGHIDYGIVPVENNSSGGVVVDTLDAFTRHDLSICNQVHRAIHQNLMARCQLNEIKVVYSKPEAFRQCQKWLAETGFITKVIEAPSTSKAAEKAAAESGAAAIGGRLAAKLYGLQVLAENIEDNPSNATRFFVLANEPAKPTGNDQTSLMLVTAHKAGALVDVLLVFQKHGINMTMITSRPSEASSLEYNFFVDVDGHADDATVKSALDDGRTHCRTLRVLGSYPKAEEVVS